VEEVQKKGGKYDYKKIYWDRDGNLRYGTATHSLTQCNLPHSLFSCFTHIGLSARNRDEEIIKILLADNIDEEDVTKVW
jgi:hypothetical protein